MGKTNRYASLGSMPLVLSIPTWLGRVVGLPGVADDAAWWAVMLPWWVWGVLLLASGVWVGFAWSNDLLRVFGGEWPDFQAWDQKDRLQMYEAACLWVNVAPQLPLPRKAKAKYGQMAKAVVADRLTVFGSVDDVLTGLMAKQSGETGPSTYVFTPHSEVTRRNLEEYARSVDERPPFLFPRERVK